MGTGVEIAWILEGKSPDQIPMARLADYIGTFAALLGETKDVRLDRVEEACTKIVASVARGKPVQRAQKRVYDIRNNVATQEAQRAFRKLNDMVGEDGGYAHLNFGSAVILRFPGRPIVEDQPVTVVEIGTITGHLYGLLEDSDGVLKARIRPRSGSTYILCTADAPVGRQLRNYFMDLVRVQGKGTWQRAKDGGWSCKSLHISEVSPIRETSFREAIDALRAVEANWPDDPFAAWDEIEQEDGAA